MKTPKERIENVKLQLKGLGKELTIDCLLVELEHEYKRYEDQSRRYRNLCNGNVLFNDTKVIPQTKIEQKINELKELRENCIVFTESWNNIHSQILVLEWLIN